MNSSNQNRVALAETVTRVNQTAAIAALKAHGIEIDGFDADKLSKLPADAVPSSVELDYVEHQGADIPTSLFGALAITGIKTYSPFDIVKEKKSLLDRMSSRAHIIDCELDIAESSSDEPARAVVFLLPDSPPFAIHSDDLLDVRPEESMDMDVNLIASVEEEFGKDAIEFLDEDTCASLIAAINRRNS